MEGWLFIFVWFCIGVLVYIYSKWKSMRLVLNWLAENNEYVVQKGGIRFRRFQDFRYATIIATTLSGKKVEIILRLKPKYISGFLEAAVVESVKESKK